MQQTVFACCGERIRLWTRDGDHISAAIRAMGGFYEPDLLAKCREIFLPGTGIVDVGANLGNHAVFFGRVLGAPVLAVEPYAPNFELLQANLMANDLADRVCARDCALGAAAGTGRMVLRSERNLGMAQLLSDAAGDVPVRTLDGLLAAGEALAGAPVGIVKIDVEGAELDVLRGAEETLRACLPDVFVEAAEPTRFRELAAWFHARGYAPVGRYAATPTYLFRACDQAARLARVLGRLGL